MVTVGNDSLSDRGQERVFRLRLFRTPLLPGRPVSRFSPPRHHPPQPQSPEQRPCSWPHLPATPQPHPELRAGAHGPPDHQCVVPRRFTACQYPLHPSRRGSRPGVPDPRPSSRGHPAPPGASRQAPRGRRQLFGWAEWLASCCRRRGGFRRCRCRRSSGRSC